MSSIADTPAAPLRGLLAVAAFLYLWRLAHNGYANTYYAAAVQAGTHSWKAFRFQELVAQGRIHYYIAAGAGGPTGGLRSQGGSASVASQIASWVAAHFKATTVGGTTVYDLSQAAAR